MITVLPFTCNFGYRSPNNSPEVNQKLEKLLQQGYYFPPTILTNFKNQDLEIIKNEIFGPVCLLMPFKTETQAIDLANNTIYGLSSVIFTDNLHRAHRISRQIDSGVVWVNTFEMGNEKTPFGGMKMSGVDRETDEDHERFFTGLRNVTILVRDEN